MQPIERYGLIALLFLVVTVVAVVLWDRGERDIATTPPGAVASERPATLAGLPAQPRGGARAAPDSTRGQPPAGAPRAGLVALPTENLPAPGQTGDAASAVGDVRATPFGGAASLLDAQRATLGAIAALRDPVQQEAALRAELQRHPEHTALLLELFREQQRVGQPSTAASLDTAGGVRPITVDDPRARTPLAQGAPAMGLAPMSIDPTPRARTYTVRSGDTLSEISQRELGTAKRYREILALNPGLDERRLVEGKVLSLPPAAAGTVATVPVQTMPAEKPHVAAAPTAAKRTYTVRSGDSLYRIAARELGDGKRHGEIAKLNPGLDADRLRAGQQLVMPEASSAPRAEPQAVAAAADRTKPVVAKPAAAKPAPVAVADATAAPKKRSSGVR